MTKIFIDMKTLLNLERMKDKTPEQEQAIKDIKKSIVEGKIELTTQMIFPCRLM